MRKADYSTLANTIATRRASVQSRIVGATPAHMYAYRMIAAEYEALARQLAPLLSVDKAAFLRACGIASEPHKPGDTR